MEQIGYVEFGKYKIDPVALATSGVSSCIAIVIEIKNKILMYHAAPEKFNAVLTCSVDDARIFLLQIYNYVDQLDPNGSIENVFLIGGWSNKNYLTLRNQINFLREQCTMNIEQNDKFFPQRFDTFVKKIVLNLIGFNLPVKTSHGKNKDENDDDCPDDYVCDCTIIYERSTVSKFIICQYAGREENMVANRDISLLQAIYKYDPSLKHFRGYVFSNAVGSPYYADFTRQVSLNVYHPTCVQYSCDGNIFKEEIEGFLSRIEPKRSLDEQ